MSMKKSGRRCRSGTSPAPITVAGAPGTEQEHAAAAEVAEDLLRERRGSGGHGRGALADRGLGADALAELQRLPEDAVEERARTRCVVGGSDLAEDLALAGNERVEA